MSTAEQRQQQRDEWHRQDVKAKAAKRNARFKRAAPPITAGMLRAVEMHPDRDREARCTMRGCPIVWREYGTGDRPCRDHADNGNATLAAAAGLGIDLAGLIETAPQQRQASEHVFE